MTTFDPKVRYLDQICKAIKEKKFDITVSRKEVDFIKSLQKDIMGRLEVFCAIELTDEDMRKIGASRAAMLQVQGSVLITRLLDFLAESAYANDIKIAGTDEMTKPKYKKTYKTELLKTTLDYISLEDEIDEMLKQKHKKHLSIVEDV